MEQEESSEVHPNLEPWVYRPEQWDNQDLHDEFKRYQAPSSFPNTIVVTLVGEGAREILQSSLTATPTALVSSDTDANFRYVDMRFVTTNCRPLCEDPEGEDRYVVMVSSRLWEAGDCSVMNMFVRPDTAREALDVLNFLRFHIYTGLSTLTQPEDPVVVLQFLRPLLVHRFEMQVHRKREDKTVQVRRVLMLDQECVGLYSDSYQEEPTDHLLLWQEQRPRSVSKVSRIISSNCIHFVSQTLNVVVHCRQPMVEELEAVFADIRSAPKTIFEEPLTMIQWLGGVKVSDGGQGSDANFAPVELDEEQEQMLNGWEWQINQSLYSKETLSQMLWNNIMPELVQKLEDDLVPVFDVNQWHYDHNNVQDLLEATGHVEQQMFYHVNYEMALAMTQALKRTFENSRVERIRKIMEDSDIDLLHKIYAGGNASSRRINIVSGNDYDDQEQDELPEEFLSDEYMHDNEDPQDMDEDEDWLSFTAAVQDYSEEGDDRQDTVMLCEGGVEDNDKGGDS